MFAAIKTSGLRLWPCLCLCLSIPAKGMLCWQSLSPT